MIKKLLLSFIFLTVLLLPLYPVYAEDSSGSAETESSSPKPPIKQIEKRLENLNTRETKLQDKIQNEREKIASKVAELKTRLAKFKDKTKANLVQKINDQLLKINTQRTDMMSSNLNKLSQIIAHLEQRSASSSANTATVQQAISDAKVKINTAKTAVSDQAKKDYTIKISSESGVKSDAMTARNSLHTDLNTVHDLIVGARKAVADAIKAFGQSLGQTQGGQN